jgi:hypothetical protein
MLHVPPQNMHICSRYLVHQALFARTTFEYRTLGKVVHVLPIMKVSYVHLS